MNDLTKILTAAPTVVLMLIVQVLVLVLTLNTHFEISIFCTGPRTSWLSWAFGLLHFSFLGLLALGMASLAWRPARPAYLILILLGLAVLPVQAMLVHSDTLKCDGP
jgi:hypothetical protein